MHILLPKTAAALLESAEGREWPKKIFHEISPWKNVADLAGVDHNLLITSDHPAEPQGQLFNDFRTSYKKGSNYMSVNRVCKAIMLWYGRVCRQCHVLRHWGVQLILAYIWARLAILVAGKCSRGMFLFLLFLHFHSCSFFFPSLSFSSSTISFISFLPFSGRWHKMTHKGWHVIKPQHNQ